MRDTIFRQYDSRWGSLSYPTRSYSFANNGCGCCAITHLLIEKDQYKKWTPKNVRPYMVDKGFATKGNGTTHAGITQTLKYFGYVAKMHSGMQSAYATLADIPKGRRAGILLMGRGTKGGVTWTTGGHYVAFLDYKVDSKGRHWFYIKDSGARKHDGWYCYETQMAHVKKIWTVQLPDSTKGKYYDVGKTYVVVSGVNVRTGASSTKYRKVGSLKKGTKVTCLQTSDNGRWIRHGKYRWSCGRDSTGKVYIK